MKNWLNAQTLFQELNINFDYLVLRNFEDFWESLVTDSHSDIDILCQKKDKKSIVKLLHAVPRLKRDDGIHYQILVDSNPVAIDFRWIGDGYYDSNWQRDMLIKRQWDDRGFYHIDIDNYFWSLLYHALYQKGKISDEYLHRLQNMKPYLFPATKENLEEKLRKYMIQNNYYYTVSRDPYLWYHFTKYCDNRMQVYPFYKIKIFLRKCHEYIKYHICRSQ